jgi:hypothetical protein
MAEKVCKQVTFYGTVATTSGEKYRLLQPHPLETARDSWMLKHQQVWLVTPAYPIESMSKVFDYAPLYSFPRQIVTSYPTIDLFLSDGWVWTGDYYDEQVEVANEEPTQEDQEWYQMNMFPEFKVIND